MSQDDQDQRTLPPSPKRLADFRRRGEIALSRDLVHAASLSTAVIAIALTMPSATAACRTLLQATLGNPGAPVGQSLTLAKQTVVAVVMPIGIAGLIGFVIVGGIQLGWPPALKRPGFDLSRVFNLNGIGDLLGPRAVLRRLATSTARMVAALGAAALAVAPELGRLMSSPSMGGAATLRALGASAARIATITIAVLIGLAVLDYLHSRRTLGKKMKMTLEEAKRESREQDGDPQIKRKRRQRMRELARRRLTATVKTADVVIVNPTEYAVALRYHTDQERAPRVVAKGRHEVAQKIRDLARAAGIPILAQPPLARLIHKLVPEGKEIPASLYHAVAEVLAYVYRLRRRAR